MTDQKLFNGELKTTIEENERLVFREANAGTAGSRNILWSAFKTLLSNFFVDKSNNQTINGVKTFNSSPLVPDPSSDLEAVNFRTLNNSFGQLPVLFIVENGTAGALTKGTIVAPDSTTIITKADAYVKLKSRVIAVLTQDLDPGETGFATKIGTINGLNTSTYSPGQILYLGTEGQFATERPNDGGFECIVAVVDVVDDVNGIITVDTRTSDLTVEINDTNGFPPDQREGTTITFSNTTRQFKIEPNVAKFHYYQTGEKYEKTTSQTVTISDVTGAHIIYFDGETLTELVNPTESQVENIILNKCIVSYIYWNATDGNYVLFNDERHGISMSPFTHLYLHKTRGAQYISGLILDSFVIGAGSLDTHAQFGNTSGEIVDEDLTDLIESNGSTAGYEYIYKTGATGAFSKANNSGFAFPVGATPLPQWNEWTGATWQLTELTSGNYMNLHLFASADVGKKLICHLGTAEYTQISAATAGQPNELATILAGLPLPEFVLIGSVIIEGKTSFTNSVNARIVQNSNGENYTNWTATELSRGASPSDHNNLAGLSLAGTGVTWGHIDNLSQSIYGKKEFVNGANSGNNLIPFSAAPTFDVLNGHVQKMPLTGNTVPSLSNKRNGDTYIIIFESDATGGHSISPDSTFGTRTDNSADPVTSATANAKYLYTIVVDPEGETIYTIETIGH